MRLSKRGAEWIHSNEGLFLNWYLDPVGVPTIGYGATMLSKTFAKWWRDNRGSLPFVRGVSITKNEALEISALMFQEEYGNAVNKHLGGKQVPQHVWDAMASASLNMGTGSLKWRWGQAAKRGDYKEAARLIQTVGLTGRNPKTGVRKRLAGLVRRRREEAELLEFGLYPKSFNKLGPRTSIEFGDKGADVDLVLRHLKVHGFYSGRIDGVFGGGAVDAVEAFQQANGLTVDGVAGPLTREALARKPKPAPLPRPVQAVIDDADKTGLASSQNKAVLGGGIATSIAAAQPIIEAVNEAQYSISTLLNAGPWVLLIIVVAIAGWWIWKERGRKAKLAQKAKDYMGDAA